MNDFRKTELNKKNPSYSGAAFHEIFLPAWLILESKLWPNAKSQENGSFPARTKEL